LYTKTTIIFRKSRLQFACLQTSHAYLSCRFAPTLTLLGFIFQLGPGKRLLGFMVQMCQVVDGANKAAVRGERILTPEERKAADDL